MFSFLATLLIACPETTPAGGSAERGDTTTVPDSTTPGQTGTSTPEDVALTLMLRSPDADAWLGEAAVTIAGQAVPRGEGALSRLDVMACRVVDDALTTLCAPAEAWQVGMDGSFSADVDLAGVDASAPTGAWTLRVMASGTLDTGAHVEGWVDVAFAVDHPLSASVLDEPGTEDWASGETRAVTLLVEDADEKGGRAEVVIEEERLNGDVIVLAQTAVEIGAPRAVPLTLSAYRPDGLAWPDDPTMPEADAFTMARTLRVTAINAAGVEVVTTVDVDGDAGDTPRVTLLDEGAPLFRAPDAPALPFLIEDTDSGTVTVRARVYAGWDGCGEGEVLQEWVLSELAVGEATWVMTADEAAALAEESNRAWGLCTTLYVQDEVGHVSASEDWGFAAVPAGCEDDDGDHYTARSDCASLPGLTVYGGGDCDDREAGANPVAEEVCDGMDDDCDGEIDENGATSDEPANDDVAGARPLIEAGTSHTVYENGKLMTAEGTAHVVGDVDWYTMTSEDGLRLNVHFAVEVRDLPTGAIALVEVFDGDGTLRTSGTGAGTFSIPGMIGDKDDTEETDWTIAVTTLELAPVGCDSTYTLFVGDI